MCGRLRVGKSFFHVCSIGRCSHVFGLQVRHTGPLAIMIALPDKNVIKSFAFVGSASAPRIIVVERRQPRRQRAG
jgi:hypothetical protein